MTTRETGTVERDYAGHDEALEMIAEFEVEQAAAELKHTEELEARHELFVAERALWRVINAGM